MMNIPDSIYARLSLFKVKGLNLKRNRVESTFINNSRHKPFPRTVEAKQGHRKDIFKMDLKEKETFGIDDPYEEEAQKLN